MNDSVLRNILSRTVVPTATGVENLFDNLLNVSILGLPLLSIPDVNLGIAATTADIAAGNTVSLQVLDKSGNLVAPGSCNLAADGIALNTPAGIAIGGNQISGLGSGTAANAAALDAIAFGNGASTGAGATGAVALGTNASVTATNGVSLGAGSTNTRGALAGYTAFGITGPSNSAGTVSFGSAGAERQLTNVAPGTAATDAATVGQVQGAILTARDGVVLYDNAGGTSVTFAGAGGTRLTNVAAGTLGAGSTDAVNGGQLFTTNQQVGTNTTNIAANTSAIATAQAGVTANTAGLAALDSAAVKYDDASHGTVTFDGAVPTRLTNVAQGAVAAASSDAVTGAQLFATNQAIAAVSGMSGLALTYDDATLASATLGGSAGTTISNLADGTVAAGSTSAVNGSQLFATNQQVGANTTAITGIDARVTQNTTNITTNTGAITTLQGQVTTNTTNIGANTGAITTLQGQVTTNTTAITNVQAGLTVNTAGLAALDASAVKYDDASHGSVTFDGATGTRLTNVAQGAVAATSSDAVTGAQLFATNQAIAAATGAPGLALTYDDATLASATLGGAAGTTITNLADGTVAAGSTSAVNGSQLFATNQQVGANTTAITNLDGRVTQNTTNITSLDGRVTQNTGDITNLTTQTNNNTGSIVAIDARVTNNSTQLTSIQNQVNNVPVGYVSDTNGTTPSATPTNTAAFEGAGGGTVRVTNVAAGTLTAGSTDAVNGSQLAATNTAVDRNRADIVSISATIGAGFAAPLQYSNGTSPTTPNGGVPTQDVTLVGADPAQPVRVHNVAEGVTANDAVNVRQLQSSVAGLQSGIASSLDQSMAYTDQQIAQVGFDLRDLRKNAFSGTAAAMAMAAIPQTITNGESMFGGAVGHYRGQTAFGFGYSTTASDRIVVKATGTIDTHGKGGVAAGAGFSF